MIDLKVVGKKQQKDYPVEADAVVCEVHRMLLLLGLGDEWTIKVRFKRIRGAYAQTSAEWHNRLATIEFDLKALSDCDGQKILRVVRHETIHIILWRMVDMMESLAPKHLELIRKYEEELACTFECMPVWDARALSPRTG